MGVLAGVQAPLGSGSLQIAVGVFAFFLGVAAVAAVAFLACWIFAPYRQRNEAYALLDPPGDDIDSRTRALGEQEITVNGVPRSYLQVLVDAHPTLVGGASKRNILNVLSYGLSDDCVPAVREILVRDMDVMLREWQLASFVDHREADLGRADRSARALGLKDVYTLTEDGKTAVLRFRSNPRRPAVSAGSERGRTPRRGTRRSGAGG